MYISIALAAFNGEKHIMEQLESFSAQTVLPDELIICDDGSTDKTIDLVSHFATTARFKVTLIENEKTLGHVQNFSKALSLCTGDVVFLSDQDDMWFPSKIETIKRVFHQNPNFWVVIHDGELTDGNLLPSGQTKMSQIRRGYGAAEMASTGALTAVQRSFLKYALPIPADIMAHDSWLHNLASLLQSRRFVLEQTLQYVRRHDKNTSSWIVNSTSKLSRLDVVRAQANTVPANDYTDRLVMNARLRARLDNTIELLKDSSDLRAAQIGQAWLARELKAIQSRQALVSAGPITRRVRAAQMLFKREYSFFNGIRSFIRDISRK